MHIRHLSILLVILSIGLHGLSAGTIPQEDYIVMNYSTDNANHPVAHAFDGDPATWWALYNEAGFSLPGSVEVDLGAEYDVNGFVYTPNPANAGTRAIGFEFYLSQDGIEWGEPETLGEFQWADASDVSAQEINIGAISARYAKLVYTSSQSGDGNVHTGDLTFQETADAATGQMNQSISFESIERKYGSDAPFELIASSSAGLDVSFNILSGPATVSGNTLSLEGSGGIVQVQAEQTGNDDYYPAYSTQSFLVIDLNEIYPEVNTRLTEDYAIEMASLAAYPIYISSSIAEPEALSIDQVLLSINGETVQADYKDNFYYYLWTPEYVGEYSIDITATASNGKQSSISRELIVTSLYNSQNVVSMEDVVIEFGGENSRWFNGSYTMPQHVGSYDKITAYLTVECPNNNCDDWDRLAHIDVQAPDGNWIQLIRYITPYGVACNHEIDVTDLSSILQGALNFRMFIDTWGTGGWQITLDFDFQKGVPDFLYSRVDEIWDGSWDLGNPANLQPVDTVNFVFPEGAQAAVLRLSNTGHGWGENNSQNAAEFYHATNFIDIDGDEFYTQDLWNDCNPNPDDCTNQAGTWQYNRAGWCPGAIAHPDRVDMSLQIWKDNIDLVYRFDPSYTDFCHPSNPDCVSGVTCPDCNDSYKARYVIDGQIISYSNSPMLPENTPVPVVDNTLIYDIQVYPNPTEDLFSIDATGLKGPSRVYLRTVSGSILDSFHFMDAKALQNQIFRLDDYPAGVYFISVENAAGTGAAKFVKR